MRLKRTTYAARSGNDEITKLSLEIKQIIKQLQEDLKTKKDIILDDYSEVMQSLTREYQTVSAAKKNKKQNKLKDFFTKTRTRKTKSKTGLINKTTC